MKIHNVQLMPTWTPETKYVFPLKKQKAEEDKQNLDD